MVSKRGFDMGDNSALGEQLCFDLSVDQDVECLASNGSTNLVVSFVNAKALSARREALERVERSGIFRVEHIGA